jgi:hypothetical protein
MIMLTSHGIASDAAGALTATWECPAAGLFVLLWGQGRDILSQACFHLAVHMEWNFKLLFLC